MSEARVAGEAAPGLAQNYDHFEEQFVQNPFPVWEKLREQEPVAHSEKYDGFYVVTRYKDVVEAANDPERFSSRDGTGIPPLPFVGLIPIDIDPPDQKEYRRIIEPALTPEAVNAREEPLRNLAISLIEPLTQEDEFDAAQELAVHLPPRATLGFLGFPKEDHDLLVRAVEDVTRLRGQETPRVAEAGQEMTMASMKLVQARREEGVDSESDDLISRMLTSEFNGRPLQDDEILRMLLLLLFGAVDTTASAIGGSLYYLATHPEAQAWMHEQRPIPRLAIEELIRWASPLQGLGRTVTRDTELAGCPLHEGDRVMLTWGSGNRDETVFENPHECAFDRRPNRHLGFGMGPHRCAGQNLGRLMLRVTLEEFLGRVGEFTLGDPDKVHWVGGEARGLRNLPLRRV